MPELPDHNKQIFFNVMSKRMSIEVFEQWVYTDQELEQTLSADSYLELISLNFKKSGVRYELFNLLQKFVGAGEYETWKLTRLLNSVKAHEINLPGLLEQLYYLYCDGYTFLSALGLGFGLSMCVLPKPYKVEHWSNLSAGELAQVVRNLPLLIINYEADLVLRWLADGSIVLTGEKNEINQYDYIDNRSDAEKARIPQYGF